MSRRPHYRRTFQCPWCYLQFHHLRTLSWHQANTHAGPPLEPR